MSAVGRIASQRRQRLLPAYVAAVIFGILGMHALMQHCPTPAHAMAEASATAQTAAQHADDHLTVVATSLDPVIGTVQLTEHPGGALGDMVMLCAAMLLGAGALLALMLRRRPGRRPFALPRPRLATWRPSLAVAGTGPPPTLAFAVIRC
jgi:putative Mn2+ efflux pump MntP